MSSSSVFMSFAAISTPPTSFKKQTASPIRLNSSLQFSSSSSTQNRLSSRLSVSCTYTEANMREDFTAAPIDVVADVKSERVVVLGGSGFVGSAICKAAVSKGIEVVSLSRSGRPNYSDPWVDQVTWIPGDVFYANWDEVLLGATAVVSTIGGFGSEEQMKKINGEANVVAVGAAKDYGIPKFVLISVHDYNLPPFLLTSGYFTGKRKAESENM